MKTVTLTVRLNQQKHALFKAICSLQHKNLQDAYESLIDNFLEQNNHWLPEKKEIEK